MMGVVYPDKGHWLGPYELGERLGAGGMAEVYVARRAGPHGFAKRFAIKRILPQLAADTRLVAMFCDEARICAALSHPNIVQVVDFGEYDGELFMAMEFVDGISCAKLLRSVAARGERFPLGAALFIVHEVLRALTFAHEASDEHGRSLGIVHRDVSPGNVLIGRAGEVKLTDFGIVRSAFVDRRTYPGELKGKLGYMSPEQVIGAEVDARSDLFAVGIVLAELLLARPLFPGRNELEVLTRIHEADLRVLDRYGRDLPADLDAALRTALARDRGARFGSAREFADALRAVARRAGVPLSDTELVPWLSSLGVLPSQSGFREATTAVAPPELLAAPAVARAPAVALAPAVAPAPAVALAPAPVPARLRPTARPGNAQPTARPGNAQPAARTGSSRGSHRPSRALRGRGNGEPARPAAVAPPGGFQLRFGRAPSVGTLTRAQLLELAATGRLGSDALVSRDGGGFRPVKQLPEVARVLARPAFQFGELPAGVVLWRRPIERMRLPAFVYELVARRETGVLVARTERREKRLHLVDGELVFASSTDRGELLGHRLVHDGLVTRADLERAIERSMDQGQTLGQALVEDGKLRPLALLRALIEQFEARVLDLFRWRGGEVAFVRNARVGEDRISSRMSSLELVTRVVRAAYPDAEIAELLAPLGTALVTRAPGAPIAASRLGLPAPERRALELGTGAPLDALVARFAEERMASAEETRRAIFIGLASGLCVMPGWRIATDR